MRIPFFPITDIAKIFEHELAPLAAVQVEGWEEKKEEGEETRFQIAMKRFRNEKD